MKDVIRLFWETWYIFSLQLSNFPCFYGGICLWLLTIHAVDISACILHILMDLYYPFQIKANGYYNCQLLFILLIKLLEYLPCLLLCHWVILVVSMLYGSCQMKHRIWLSFYFYIFLGHITGKFSEITRKFIASSKLPVHSVNNQDNSKLVLLPVVGLCLSWGIRKLKTISGQSVSLKLVCPNKWSHHFLMRSALFWRQTLIITLFWNYSPSREIRNASILSKKKEMHASFLGPKFLCLLYKSWQREIWWLEIFIYLLTLYQAGYSRRSN